MKTQKSVDNTQTDNKDQSEIIWKNDQEIIRVISAYKSFVETLKTRVQYIPHHKEFVLNKSAFLDILDGATEIKNALRKDVENRAGKNPDPEIGEILFERLEVKFKVIDKVVEQIKSSLTGEIDHIYGTVTIKPDCIIFLPSGDISFDEDAVIDKNFVIRLDTETKRNIHKKAKLLMSQLKEFNDYVSESSSGRFFGIHARQYSDKTVLTIDVDYSIEIDPFVIDQV